MFGEKGTCTLWENHKLYTGSSSGTTAGLIVPYSSLYGPGEPQSLSIGLYSAALSENR